ncbi:MAG: N-6 DNA methylase [Oligosphaeraceae bacterium]
MAIKKSQLYSTLWESCNALRGSMDASQYKDYVLIILFVKYLSDKVKQGEMEDIRLPEGCFFEDFVKLKQNSGIGEQINIKLEAIKEANVKILNISLPNFNDPEKFGPPKQMTETLSKLIGVFENDALDFGRNRAVDDDLLGDAYEYLMKNFAVESGKSKGQFYTPAEVSRVMAQVLHLQESNHRSDTIYDPTGGSGSLLLRANAETQRGATLYMQEKNNSTASLAKLNMLLHGIADAEIYHGDTLNDPQFKEAGLLKTFDYCVANPPFSQKNWLAQNGENDPYHRWSMTLLPPRKIGDYAFLLHLVASMKPETGRGACIMPHGVLFRGNAEETIRKELARNRKVIKGIIGLPPNIFFGTPIPAAILVLDNRRSEKGIFFLDASRDFLKDGNKNRLREQDIRKIVDTFNAQLEIPHYSRLVPYEEIERNGWNLNIPRYIEPVSTEVAQDLDGHLNGGISCAELDSCGNWDALPGLKEKLVTPLRPGYVSLAIPPEQVTDFIRNADVVKTIMTSVREILAQWEGQFRTSLSTPTGNARKLVENLACALRDAYQDCPFLDKYDAYGVFMDYALATLQDDLFAICADGWTIGRETEKDFGKKEKLKSWEGMILPKLLVKQELYPTELARVQGLASAEEEAEQALEQFVQECSDLGDDDPLAELKDDDKICSDADAKKKEKELRMAPERTDEADAIRRYLELRKTLSAARKASSEAEKTLDLKTLERYSTLTDEEIRLLMVERKWLPAIHKGMENLCDNQLQNLATSLLALHERYRETLPELERQCQEAQERVHAVLREMGFQWQE